MRYPNKSIAALLIIAAIPVAAISFMKYHADHYTAFPCIVRMPEKSVQSKTVVVLSPHPDDEYEGWAAMDNDETPVFVSLTLGEKSWTCKKISASECKAKRINAEMFFLNNMMSRPHGLLFMDIGDKKLSKANLARSLTPLIQELKPEKIIVAAYYNEESGCTSYKHPDHKALHDFMKSATWDVPVYIRVASCEQSEKKTLYVDQHVHARTWGEGGIGRRAYDWLQGGGWHAGESDRDKISFFTRRQDFIVIEPAGHQAAKTPDERGRQQQ